MGNDAKELSKKGNLFPDIAKIRNVSNPLNRSAQYWIRAVSLTADRTTTAESGPRLHAPCYYDGTHTQCSMYLSTIDARPHCPHKL